MKYSIRFVRALAMAAGLLLVVSCSSDSSDSPTSMESPDGTLTGAFIDSPVSGLSYQTSSGLSGFTNAAGEFKYLAGDTVTFLLGVLELGSIVGAPTITPFDLVGFELDGEDLSLADLAQDILESDLTNTATKFEQGVNMLILLQSLDRNNNADDGIEITSSVFQFFTTTVISLLFNTDTRDFINEFLQLFINLVTGGILSRDADDQPVDRDQALVHFLSGL